MTVFLGLGSNLGDRETNLRTAVFQLQLRGLKLNRAASVYSTEPRDYAEQPWFLNTVVEIETGLSPENLLETCLSIEQQAGRIRRAPKGPRTIDIDIILYDSIVLETPTLVIPHPEYTTRRFVLAPLMEIAPDFVDPKKGLPIKELYAALTDPGDVELFSPPLF